jgi:hypothetical protein
MPLTATALTQPLSARIQVKTYPFSSILRQVWSLVPLGIQRASIRYTAKVAAVPGSNILDKVLPAGGYFKRFRSCEIEKKT